MAGDNLEHVRGYLRSEIQESGDKIHAEARDTLEVMDVVKAHGKNIVAENVLRMLPQEEFDVVKDAQAYLRLQQKGFRFDRSDTEKAASLVDDALEAVVGRIEVTDEKETTHGVQFTFKDPITRISVNHMISRELDVEEHIKMMKDDMAEHVVYEK